MLKGFSYPSMANFLMNVLSGVNINMHDEIDKYEIEPKTGHFEIVEQYLKKYGVQYKIKETLPADPIKLDRGGDTIILCFDFVDNEFLRTSLEEVSEPLKDARNTILSCLNGVNRQKSQQQVMSQKTSRNM